MPRDGHQGALLADHRVGETIVPVDRIRQEPALVAQPAVVDRVDVDAQQAGQPVGGRLHRHPAAERTGGAGRLDLVEIPRTGREPVGRRGQRPDRADLHRVAGEVGGERQLGERADLDVLPPADEVDLGLAGHLVREAGAAAALDAPLAVEQHQLGDRHRLLEVALLLDEPGLPGPVGERLVLERALAALVAHRAVERVVDQQELEDAVLGLLDLVRVGGDLHARRDLDEAARLQRGTAGTADLDQAHPAHADRLHPRVVAEPRDERAGPLGGGDEQLTLVGARRPAVEGELDGRRVRGVPGTGVCRGRGGRLSHRGSHPP